MTTDNFYFYLQNRLILTSQTGGHPLVFPGIAIALACIFTKWNIFKMGSEFTTNDDENDKLFISF
jgi:hypothetical protein